MQTDKFGKKLISSLDNHSQGFSGRKISAAIAVLTCVVISLLYTEPANAVHMVMVWLCFAAICLGIVTIEQVIKLKNGGTSTTTSTETITTETSNKKNEETTDNNPN